MKNNEEKKIQMINNLLKTKEMFILYFHCQIITEVIEQFLVHVINYISYCSQIKIHKIKRKYLHYRSQRDWRRQILISGISGKKLIRF